MHLLQCEEYVSFHKLAPEALQEKMGSYVVLLNNVKLWLISLKLINFKLVKLFFEEQFNSVYESMIYIKV